MEDNRRDAWRDRQADARRDRERRIDDIRGQRTQSREDGRTVIREPDRTIIREGNRIIIRHDDTARFRDRGDVRVERRGGDRITTVTRPDGTRIVTVVDDRDRLVRRTRIDRAGREVVLIDSRPRPYFGPPPVVMLPPPRIMIPRERYIVEATEVPPPVIYETLSAAPVEVIERPYSLDEIVHSVQVRDRMPRIDLDSITFATGSWEIDALQAQKLAGIADAMKNVIARNPAEMFLVEGHTDAVGAEIDNLSLSDRRAESVAMVLTQEFGVPPENLQTQGYGEEFLKVPTTGASRENRRVAIRRITPLLSGTAQAVR
ncbi:MAG: OmpA family protein [Alphaproteobacteria bacterium]|nr:OmpA family protein [Alphaproteobacteria bacterium]